MSFVKDDAKVGIFFYTTKYLVKYFTPIIYF